MKAAVAWPDGIPHDLGDPNPVSTSLDSRWWVYRKCACPQHQNISAGKWKQNCAVCDPYRYSAKKAASGMQGGWWETQICLRPTLISSTLRKTATLCATMQTSYCQNVKLNTECILIHWISNIFDKFMCSVTSVETESVRSEVWMTCLITLEKLRTPNKT